MRHIDARVTMQRVVRHGRNMTPPVPLGAHTARRRLITRLSVDHLPGTEYQYFSNRAVQLSVYILRTKVLVTYTYKYSIHTRYSMGSLFSEGVSGVHRFWR